MTTRMSDGQEQQPSTPDVGLLDYQETVDLLMSWAGLEVDVFAYPDPPGDYDHQKVAMSGTLAARPGGNDALYNGFTVGGPEHYFRMAREQHRETRHLGMRLRGYVDAGVRQAGILDAVTIVFRHDFCVEVQLPDGKDTPLERPTPADQNVAAPSLGSGLDALPSGSGPPNRDRSLPAASTAVTSVEVTVVFGHGVDRDPLASASNVAREVSQLLGDEHPGLLMRPDERTIRVLPPEQPEDSTWPRVHFIARLSIPDAALTDTTSAQAVVERHVSAMQAAHAFLTITYDADAVRVEPSEN